MTRTLLLLALAVGSAQAQQATPPPTPKPADTKPPATASPAKSGSINLTVTSQTGLLLADAAVRAEGPTSREGKTGADGNVVLSNTAAGTYRVRIEHDGYITLEKEIAVKAGAKSATEAVLAAAPPPPPPPAPPAVAPAGPPPLAPGVAKMASLTDTILEQLLRAPAPIAEQLIGCSGATSAHLIRIKDTLPSATLPDTDEMIYIVGGDATLTIAGKDQAVTAGWLGIVPRGSARGLTRRGKNPVVVLSIQSGPPCASSSGAPGTGIK